MALAAVIGVTGASQATVISNILSSTDSHYQMQNGGADSDYYDIVANGAPGYVEARSFVSIGGDTGLGRSDRTTCWDDADAWSSVLRPGQERMYARAGGWSPGGTPPEDVDASAFARINSTWMAVSSGTSPVGVDLVYFLEGWLFAAYYTDEAFAEVEASVSFYAGGELFRAGATLGGGTGLTTDFYAINGWSDSEWTSAWADTSGTITSPVRGSQDKMHDLNYLEVVDDLIYVTPNMPFSITYELRVRAHTPGPYEIFATSDFSDTATFGLSTNDAGAQMVELFGAVPEPSTIAVLGIGALAILRRRAV